MQRIALNLMPLCFVLVGASCTDDSRAAVEEGEWLPGGDTTNTFLFGSNALSMPSENIEFEHDLMFASGNSFFNQAWVEAPSSTESRDGLGPLYNARSCSACHFRDGRGRAPEGDEDFLGLLLRTSIPGAKAGAGADPDPSYGGQLQPFAISGVTAEGKPQVRYEEISGAYDDGTAYQLRSPEYSVADLGYGPLSPVLQLSARVAPSMTGLGLLQAISVEDIEKLEDPDDVDGDGISGKANWVSAVGSEELALGRFGWKAEQPTVRQQSAGAFNGDMGITSDEFPIEGCTEVQAECQNSMSGGTPEISKRLMDRVEVYGMMLAPPARQDYKSEKTLQGKQLFSDGGCAACHTPTFTTSTLESFPELSNQRIWPYSDLLLHQMGTGLADEQSSFLAEPGEWRTPPLWGLRFYKIVNRHDQLMHDGRARGVAEAILWHGGEAEDSQMFFRALSKSNRDALIHFVESL